MLRSQIAIDPRDLMSNFIQTLRFRHLALVESLATHGTMHRATEALNMTQSTGSKMLMDVEAMVGCPLFVREPRGMRVTEMGELFVAHAREQLGRLRRFEEGFSAMRQGGYGTLVVGAIMGSAPDLVARTVAEVKRARPHMTVRLVGETSDQIISLLERGDLDLAVGRVSDPRAREAFRFEPLADEPLAVVVRAGHTLDSPGRPLSLTALIAHPWVLQPTSTPARRVLDAAFAEAGRQPTDVVEAVSIFGILHLVQQSDAVALLPLAVVRDHIRAGLLAQLQMTEMMSIAGFGLITRRDAPLSEAAAMFAAALRRNAHVSEEASEALST
ncbi:LysR family transcriptional regulator [Acuticoccus sp. I52.16.1]|uniref:LysR family transcriptional regulator n=1 Tax=Acuticoccus sp. I52.16.1 TaxID=2928472 RepID=UPI001FD1937C|nr:LysR family transcriptional regulator [Acuticoccus sp. I52.16.1]UOM33254.1 LysR family transcriptional regulator [Acuticoccus sp. I52.16.1]